MANPMNHSPAYRRRRFFNWFPLGLTYAVYYMGRYNLNVSSTTIMEKFDLTKTDFGIIAGILMLRLWNETPLKKAKSASAEESALSGEEYSVEDV